MPKLMEIGLTILVIGVGFIILGNIMKTTGAFAASEFKPGFAKGVRTMCDNSGCYAVN